MSIHPPAATAPAAVLLAARDQVVELAVRLPAGLSDVELVEGLQAIQVLDGAKAALEASLLVELDDREIPRKVLHWGSTGDWFTHLAGLHRRQGHRRVRHAHQLVTDRPATLEALRAGQTSPTQAGVICEAVKVLPGAVQDQAEATLLAESTRLNATELAKAGRHIAAVVDPDGEDRAAEKALDREERAAHLDRFLSITEDGMGGVRLKGRGSAEDGAVLKAALLPLTKPAPAVDPDNPDCSTDCGTDCGKERDPRDHGARNWDALVQLAQHGLDTELPPGSHSARPRITVTIPLANIQTGLGQAAVTETGIDLCIATARRLACDADLIPAVLGTNGEVLDVGRAYRLVTAALWVALCLRDQHCAFPGCTRPPVMCHAHHITHWLNGGVTSLQNLVMLCGEHHRVIHHTPWQVRLNPHDGQPEFLPPPKHRHEEPQVLEWTRHRPRCE